MKSNLVILCFGLLVLSLVAANITLRGDTSNYSVKANENATTVKNLEEFCVNLEKENVKATEDLKSTGDLSETTEADQSDGLESVWLNVPVLPIAYARSSSLPDGPCKSQAQLYLRNLKNETLWATQMFDASTKYPDGIISGHTRHLGNFDLCYNLNVTLRNYNYEDSLIEEEITGRYCLVDIEYEKQGLPPIDPLERHELQFDPQSSVWEAIREKGDFRRVKRYKLQMALCVPEVCTAAEIEAALQEPFAQVGIKQNVHFNVSVKPKFCQALKDAPKFTLGAKIYCSVVLGLLLLVIFGTWYDYSLKECKEKDGSVANDFVLCFSARKNFNTLMEIKSGHPGLDTIHLTRFFYLVLTLLGHRCQEYYATSVINASYIEWMYKYQLSMLFFAGPQVTDGFLSIGGFLVSYMLLGELDKIKKFNFLGAMLIRFLRLTPTYALVIFFHILVLPYIGSGPYWEWKIGMDRDGCANNWWANILYINNYVNPEQICMFQSWYLAADYQLFTLALLVTYAFWRMPRKWGYPFLCLVILSGCVTPFVNTYFYGVEPMFKGLLYKHDLREDSYFTQHYIKTHERIPSYFMGVLVGAVLYDHNRHPWRLSKVASHVTFILFSVILAIGTQLYGHKFYDPNRNPVGLEAALYACLHRVAFATACTSIVVLITVGQGLTFQYNFLTPRWVQPLGRLTFGTFLVHTVFQLHALSVTRTARQFTFQTMFWNIMSDVVYSFFVAFLLYLAVEAPFRVIERRFIMQREKRRTSKVEKTRIKKTN